MTDLKKIVVDHHDLIGKIGELLDGNRELILECDKFKEVVAMQNSEIAELQSKNNMLLDEFMRNRELTLERDALRKENEELKEHDTFIQAARLRDELNEEQLDHESCKKALEHTRKMYSVLIKQTEGTEKLLEKVCAERDDLKKERDHYKTQYELYFDAHKRVAEACEPLRGDQSLGLKLGDRITVDGVRALIKQRDMLQSQHDMFRDEFLRIKACPGADSEIKGLCDRAVKDIERCVPLIADFESQKLENAELRRERDEARQRAAALKEDLFVFLERRPPTCIECSKEMTAHSEKGWECKRCHARVTGWTETMFRVHKKMITGAYAELKEPTKMEHMDEVRRERDSLQEKLDEALKSIEFQKEKISLKDSIISGLVDDVKKAKGQFLDVVARDDAKEIERLERESAQRLLVIEAALKKLNLAHIKYQDYDELIKVIEGLPYMSAIYTGTPFVTPSVCGTAGSPMTKEVKYTFGPCSDNQAGAWNESCTISKPMGAPTWPRYTQRQGPEMEAPDIRDTVTSNSLKEPTAKEIGGDQLSQDNIEKLLNEEEIGGEQLDPGKAIQDAQVKKTCGSCVHFHDATALETWCDMKDKECVESKTPACAAYRAKDVLHYACALCGKEPRKLVYGYGCPDNNCPNYRLDVSLENWNDNAEAQKARKEKEDKR